MGELREVGVENGSCCDGNSNRHAVGSGDGNHHDGDCSHGREEGHDRNSRQKVDSRLLDGKVEASESDSDRCGELHLGSVDGFSRGSI